MSYSKWVDKENVFRDLSPNELCHVSGGLEDIDYFVGEEAEGGGVGGGEGGSDSPSLGSPPPGTSSKPIPASQNPPGTPPDFSCREVIIPGNGSNPSSSAIVCLPKPKKGT